MERGEDRGSVSVRNPYSTRPYQHVLEPLAMYMMLAARQYADCSLADWYNVGPDDCDCVTTGDLVELFCRGWNRIRGELPEAAWENKVREGEPHEAGFLKLDSSKIKARLGYVPRWHIQECLEKTAEFAKIYLSESGLIPAEMDREISEFMMKNGQGS
jgi:CDP-glucose 4,6-dehydratase